jgi:methyltransferase-like protein
MLNIELHKNMTSTKTQKLLFFSILFILMNCASQRTSNFKEIIYDATTRGRSKKITITDGFVQYKTHQESSSFKLTKYQQEKITEAISKIDLTKINRLKSPTNKRLFDGAMHTFIAIKSNSKEYTSNSFDDTNPPTELKNLCDLLLSFIQK